MKRLLPFLALLFSMNAWSQKKLITGTVINQSTQAPLAGATVNGHYQTVTTDSAGRFSILSGPKDQLTVSFVGMDTRLVLPKGSGGIAIQLEPRKNDLDQVIITGYTAERKKDLTGAVSVVNMDDIKDVPEGNAMKALQGRVPGMFVAADGSLNGAVSVTLRGITTLNDNNPLYIIDGIPSERGLQELNQNDIESIQVLRDASSATIYGSRAAAGVIIVTTKKGKNGVRRVDLNVSTSVQYYNSKLQPLNTLQHGQAYWRAAVNSNQDPNLNGIYTYDWNQDFTNPILNKVNIPTYVDAAQTMLSANTNWFNQISQPSILHSYDISMSNGSDRGTSLFSVGFYDNSGIIKASNDTKVTARFNSDYNFLHGRLKIGENFSATYMRDVILPVSSITLLSLIENPIIPVHTVTGGWGGPVAGMDDRDNPVRLIADNKQNKNNFGRVFGNVYVDLAILPNLHFNSSAGIDEAGNYFRSILLPYQAGFLSSTITQAGASFDQEGTFSWHNTLTYDLSIKNHRLTLLAGEEEVKDKNQNFNASAQGLAIADINYSYLSAGTNTVLAAGAGSGDALISYFGKANYSYDNKYLLSATLRDDGSSKFGPDNRFGLFPAFSAGWRLSQEEFVKNSAPFISDLKLRYGWGQTGNQNIANNATYTLFQSIYATDLTWAASTGTAYNISGSGTGSMPSGFTPIQQGNPNLKWETTTQSNFGLDFGFFNNRLSGAVDYYIKKTTNILISPPYLAVLGLGGNTWFNGASLQNKGLEAIATYRGNITKDLSFSFTGNIATYRNKVLYLPSEVLTGYAGNGTTQTVLGRSVNSLFGYVADGLFTSQDEVNNSAAQPGKGLGRIRYADLNKDNTIDNNDQRFLGKSDPDFTYGLNASFSYKNFDLSFFFQGVKGGLVYNSYKYLTDFTSLAPGSNWGKRTLDAWTPQNPKSSIPALTLVDANNEGRYSSYYLESGSYLKLRNIQMAYNLKNGLRTSKVKVAKVYIQASNLLRFKSHSYTAPDPENPSSAYPIPVIATAGANFTF